MHSRPNQKCILKEILHEFGCIHLIRCMSLFRLTSPLFGALILIFSFLACSSPLPPPSETERAVADSALEQLSQIHLDHISDAFQKISNWSYTRLDRTESRGERQYSSFTHFVNVVPSGPPIVILGSDSILAKDISTTFETIVQDDAPYLMPEFKDQFQYEIRRDTSYWSQPVNQITIDTRPESTEEILNASYLYDPNSLKLVSMTFHRHSQSILLEEVSRYRLQLRPVNNEWVPYHLSMHLAMRLPFGRQNTYTYDITFFDYIPR